MNLELYEINLICIVPAGQDPTNLHATSFGIIPLQTVFMNNHLSIKTPEQIELTYSVAGIGSRFYAAMLDTLLLTLIGVIGGFVIATAITELDDIFGNWLAAIGGLVVFALFWGYYMLFEVTMNGQSPGKRALGLRVIKEGGYPVSFADSAIRNLVRIIDFLPFCYGIGLIAMLMNKNWRRLGDLAAGTLVVRDGTKSANAGNLPAAQPRPQSALTYADWMQPELVTAAELEAVRMYLSRRAMLPKLRRQELARTLAAPIVQKMGGSTRVDYEVFLYELHILMNQQQ